MPSLVKTTGSKGLHVYVPIVRGPMQKQVWTFAKALAQELATRIPALMTAEYRVAKRPKGRVLVDYNQNALGPHARVDLFGAAAAGGDGVDAGDLEGSRARRPHRGLHDPATCRRASTKRGDLWKPLLQKRGRFDLGDVRVRTARAPPGHRRGVRRRGLKSST